MLSRIDPRVTAVADRKYESVLGKSVAGSPTDTIVETTYAPNRLTYRAHSVNGGVAVFSEVFFPWGWTATIDGKPVELGRVDYVLRAMRVPAGDHEIVMSFDPPSLHTTDTLATVSIMIIYLALLAAIVLGVGKFIGRKPDEKKA